MPLLGVSLLLAPFGGPSSASLLGLSAPWEAYDGALSPAPRRGRISGTRHTSMTCLRHVRQAASRPSLPHGGVRHWWRAGSAAVLPWRSSRDRESSRLSSLPRRAAQSAWCQILAVYVHVDYDADYVN